MNAFFGKFGKKKETDKKSESVEDAKVEKKEKKVAKPKKEKKNTPVVAEKKEKKEKVTTTTASFGGHEDIARVLMNPRMTEKATMGIENSVYVFDVATNSNKKQIKEAIKLIYNVDAKKVHVTTIAKKIKRNSRTGIKGVKSGGKKAYVYLKKGDKISLM